MKFADAQMDVLLRRHGRQATSSAFGEHLDADELNAFAEGAAPEAARSRYVAHLADCDECRKLATQLAISAGAVAKVASGSIPATRESIWQRVTCFFMPPTLRYAAFAAVVIMAVGVTFIVLREQSRRSFSSAIAPSVERRALQTESPEAREHVAQTLVTPSAPPAGQLDKNASSNSRQEQPKALDGLAPPKPGKDEIATTKPAEAEKRKTDEPMVAAKRQPSYAPLPPEEAGRPQTKTREESDRLASGASVPQKTEAATEQSKVDRSRAGELARDQRISGPNRGAMNQQTQNQSTQSSNEARPLFKAAKEAENQPASKTASGTARADDADKAPETRSLHGHKFRRQGNAWIDVKYRSSMTIVDVSRGSDEFRALNSDLRSIAEQLGGEVIVVRSGKAYRIK